MDAKKRGAVRRASDGGRGIAAKAALARWVTERRADVDAINRPAHYTSGRVEVIDAIEAWQLGYRLGNVVKYVARAGKKDPTKALEDLRKGMWYLQREIASRQRGAE